MSLRHTPQIRSHAVRVSDRTTWTFVEVRDGPYCGIGEATLEGRSDEVRLALDRFGAALLASPEPLGPAGFAQIDSWLNASRGSLLEATALSALEQAIQDLCAQREGQPLHARLGHALRQRIPLYANINRGTVPRTAERFAERALRAAHQGFRAIKLAPFDGVTPQPDTGRQAMVDAGLARIAAVSDALRNQAPGCRLMIDCHWRFDAPLARQMVVELTRLGVSWYECPVPETADHYPLIRELRSLANDAGMELAGAELMVGYDGFLPLLKAGLYDVVMPDVKHAGGLAETLRIADAAAQHGTACSPHNPTGPICHAHSLHVAALIPNMPALEVQFEESERFHTLADSRLPRFADGSSALPEGPGLGVGCQFDSSNLQDLDR